MVGLGIVTCAETLRWLCILTYIVTIPRRRVPSREDAAAKAAQRNPDDHNNLGHSVLPPAGGATGARSAVPSNVDGRERDLEMAHLPAAHAEESSAVPAGAAYARHNAHPATAAATGKNAPTPVYHHDAHYDAHQHARSQRDLQNPRARAGPYEDDHLGGHHTGRSFFHCLFSIWNALYLVILIAYLIALLVLESTSGLFQFGVLPPGAGQNNNNFLFPTYGYGQQSPEDGLVFPYQVFVVSLLVCGFTIGMNYYAHLRDDRVGNLVAFTTILVQCASWWHMCWPIVYAFLTSDGDAYQIFCGDGFQSAWSGDNSDRVCRTTQTMAALGLAFWIVLMLNMLTLLIRWLIHPRRAPLIEQRMADRLLHNTPGVMYPAGAGGYPSGVSSTLPADHVVVEKPHEPVHNSTAPGSVVVTQNAPRAPTGSVPPVTDHHHGFMHPHSNMHASTTTSNAYGAAHYPHAVEGTTYPAGISDTMELDHLACVRGHPLHDVILQDNRSPARIWFGTWMALTIIGWVLWAAAVSKEGLRAYWMPPIYIESVDANGVPQATRYISIASDMFQFIVRKTMTSRRTLARWTCADNCNLPGLLVSLHRSSTSSRSRSSSRSTSPRI